MANVVIPLWLARRRGLSAPAKLLFGAIDLLARRGVVDPSVDELVDLLGSARGVVRRATKELEGARCVCGEPLLRVVERSTDTGCRLSHRYDAHAGRRCVVDDKSRRPEGASPEPAKVVSLDDVRRRRSPEPTA